MDRFPEIVSFRITSLCTQNCRCCYGPKNIPSLGFEKLKEIFRLLAKNGVKGIVITGGEPLIRDDIRRILKELKKHEFKVFLDTNGDLFFEQKEAIDSFVDVLGLPVDSVSEQGSYRKNNNLSNVLKILEYYKNLKKRPKIKIGTVATSENINELRKIADLLKDYSVDMWKIYQFIPIGQVAALNQKDLLVEDGIFLREANNIRHEYGRFFEIIISPREERVNAYFLINPDGKVIMPTDGRVEWEDMVIGDIFDNEIVGKWQKAVFERNYLDNAEITFYHKWENYPMKPIYNRILQVAQRYNRKGQFYTTDHIGWHIKESLTIVKNESVDEEIFIPFTILHDVGYSQVDRESPFDKKVRKIHMEAGREIAKKVLGSVDYPKDKTEKISSYVSIHDSWALGYNEIYQNDKILGIFNDLDYISMFSREGFPAMKKILNKNSVDLLDYLEDNEKIRLRPFLVDSTRNLFNKYISQKRQELFVG